MSVSQKWEKETYPAVGAPWVKPKKERVIKKPDSRDGLHFLAFLGNFQAPFLLCSYEAEARQCVHHENGTSTDLLLA